MSKFAEDTRVPAERSRMEIEKILQKYGATGFFFASEEGCATIGFRAADRLVRFTVPLPPVSEFEMAGRRRRKAEEQRNAHAQSIRQKWRCLALAIKAKLEIVESGIATFEEEFLAHILTHDGRTVGQVVVPRLAESYIKGKDIPLLPPMRVTRDAVVEAESV